MAEPNCPNCAWRAKYDANPKSFLGRLWKIHTRFCPGWNGYIASLSDEEKKKLLDEKGRPLSR